MCAVSPSRYESKLCECAGCGCDIDKNYTFFKDNEDNYFCSVECGVDYHEIKETDFERERPSYE